MVNQDVGNESFRDFICKMDGAVSSLCVAFNESMIEDQQLQMAIENLKQVNRLGQDIYLGRDD